MQTNEKELIRTAVEAYPYLNAKDLEEIAKEVGIKVQNVRAAVAGRSKKCKANGLIIEYGRMRQAEARQRAEKIFNKVNKIKRICTKKY